MLIESCKEFVRHLKEYREFCIVYHENPDGDCIGSAYGLALALRSAGCRCAVLGQHKVPEAFRETVGEWTQDPLSDPVYLAVDCADRARTGKDHLDHPYRFWIDHHGAADEQAEFELTDPHRSACSELILEVIEEYGIPVTPQIADLLYTAIITDTNCFRSPCLDRRTFETAARLAGYGAAVKTIGRQHRFLRPEKRMRIEQAMLDRTHFLHDGRLITVIVRK
ncbi:MAG: DHH family phosphoesterase, partial [Oscillospiraceae bacterium]|nr:DHH family phosphoesterase [Oscillospiraceae bacterium]